MSYTAVKSLWPGERAEDYERLHNASIGLAVVWEYMYKTYVLSNVKRYLIEPIPDYMFKRWSDNQSIWAGGIFQSYTIPKHQRAVLALGFDCAHVERKDYALAASDIRKIIVDVGDLGFQTHLPRLAEIFESKPDCPAIGVWFTSVAPDPYLGTYNPKTDSYDEFGWEHSWSIYDCLEA